jgi:hypothetical protein
MSLRWTAPLIDPAFTRVLRVDLLPASVRGLHRGTPRSGAASRSLATSSAEFARTSPPAELSASVNASNSIEVWRRRDGGANLTLGLPGVAP